MITVSEALNILLEACPGPAVKSQSLHESSGFVLAGDVLSPIDSPPFDQSAMDGFALLTHSVQTGVPTPVTLDIPAGSTRQRILENGTLARIYTGAPLPEQADTIVIVEDTVETREGVIINMPEIKQGMHIRRKGSQIMQGEKAASQGLLLHPGSLGFLAGLGVQQVEVFSKPRVGIIVTGDELMETGNALAFGQIYESNSIALRAALKAFDIPVVFFKHVKDDEALLEETIREVIQDCDLLLLTGGVSVGRYDFVYSALEKSGTEKLFHKVRQRPGKPLFAGRCNDTMVLGLPGNPASVMTCFYKYAVPLIRKLCGLAKAEPDLITLPLAQSFTKKPGLTWMLKARAEQGEVLILEGQESYKMMAFTEANALVMLNEEDGILKKGDLVKVLMMRDLWI